MSLECLECEVCGADLANDVDRGWVSWFTDENDVVLHFYVSCSNTDEENPCAARLERRHQGLHLLDHHLDRFVGKESMWRLQDVLWTYRWPFQGDVTRKLFDFFLIAEKLSVPKPGRLKRARA